MYFLQASGEPLSLRFVKAHYGPYAENLRHVLLAVEGHLIAGYANGGDAPGKQLNLVPGAVRDAEGFLATHAATRERFERVVRLVEGFETPLGLELLSTVHWLMTKEHLQSTDALVRSVQDWVSRKRRFTPAQIELAATRFDAQGWL